VLARNGCELAEARGQVCCGALHAHAGQLETARELARRNIEAFAAGGADRIIVNAAGCGAAMKEYRELLADDPNFAERAIDFSARVRDVSEFLIEIGIRTPDGLSNRVVAYDAPCHLIHAQRIANAPVELLRAIPGITLVPLRGFESCCGGAGIYNLQHAELSSEILNDKIASIRESGADTVATANPGCIMQLGAGVLLSGLKVDVVHPIDLLDAAYEELRRAVSWVRRVRGRISFKVCLIAALHLFMWAASYGQSSNGSSYGPEVRSFLDLMRHEEDELEFQIKRREISRRDYLRAKNQIIIHRQTVLDLARESGQDNVPELHVVAMDQVDQLIEDGTTTIKTLKPGEIIAAKWRYLGSVHRTETFYIFERLTPK
jgi:hypothetical protein